jgi:peptidoglycan/xylan/chitin deacetylase (PgdA/CDA1 family)
MLCGRHFDLCHLEIMKVINTACYYPRCTQWHVNRALMCVNPIDLDGIEAVKIVDEPPLSPKEKKQPYYLRQIISGRYVRKQQRQNAHILLFTKNLYFGLPLLLKFTPIATLQIAMTLAHEIGHHLISHRGYIYLSNENYADSEKREIMADRYAYEALRKMSSKWYYRYSLKFSFWLSNFYYDYGLVTWQNQEYDRSIYYWACAYALNPENIEALHGYKKAIVKRNSSSP